MEEVKVVREKMRKMMGSVKVGEKLRKVKGKMTEVKEYVREKARRMKELNRRREEETSCLYLM